jgi:hypothetical protein
MGFAKYSLGALYGGSTKTAAVATMDVGSNFSFKIAAEESAAITLKGFTTLY